MADTCPYHQDCVEKAEEQSTKIALMQQAYTNIEKKVDEKHQETVDRITTGIEWMKWLVGLFIGQIVMTLGGGIWFWASDHSQQVEMYREIREMKPRVDELWFRKTSYYPLQQGEVISEN